MKIATCCYCGTRAALVLDKRRHELACSACGAPLHEMKMIPQPAKKARPASPATHYPSPKPRKSEKPKRKKRGKSFKRKIFEEIWDVVEDIFD